MRKLTNTANRYWGLPVYAGADRTKNKVILHLLIIKKNTMAKSQDSKKNVKKEPAKTAKEKRAAKREKKANKG